ncbi:DUF4387 domain-containing protein [Vallitalea okinawensis]|uniref:DUF4387 domain-containing protein n=1 Tax=Vallitalea okinawensis TaxID=2078660 RepID=UPI00147896AE|nr:DUF4387 domain-containing protein [Vallitalea okinawensis]
MKITLMEAAKVIRSKNAGPFTLTFDILFKDENYYNTFKEKQLLTKEIMAEAYKCDVDVIEEIIYFDPSKAMKINIHRPIASGDVGERDVYGAQQHVPLTKLEFEI